jgi:hypothetical protein
MVRREIMYQFQLMAVIVILLTVIAATFVWWCLLCAKGADENLALILPVEEADFEACVEDALEVSAAGHVPAPLQLMSDR